MGLIITEHAKRRYAERVMNREENYDINKFILDHDSDIHKNISKMVEHGTKIYSGKMKEHNFAHFYVNGNWVVVLDKEEEKVITLYSVDLGCDEELNTIFVNKMLEQLKSLQEKITFKQEEVNSKNEELRKEIQYYEDRISQLNGQVKYFKNLIEANKNIVQNNIVLVSELKSEYKDKVESLVRAKVF